MNNDVRAKIEAEQDKDFMDEVRAMMDGYPVVFKERCALGAIVKDTEFRLFDVLARIAAGADDCPTTWEEESL